MVGTIYVGCVMINYICRNLIDDG